MAQKKESAKERKENTKDAAFPDDKTYEDNSELFGSGYKNTKKSKSRGKNMSEKEKREALNKYVNSRKYKKNINKKVDEFDERMKDNVKKKRKMAKEMEKPQYSDPSYFGHKKKPKKRKPGKRKYCKECKMVH